MNNNLELKQSIEINAGADKVWDALINPAKIKQYLFGTDTITDWKVGSPLVFQGEYEGKQYKDKGTILANKEKELLSYTYWSGFSGLEDKPENYSTLAFHLQSNNGKTTLTLNQRGFTNEESKKHSGENWGKVFEKLKEIVEKDSK